MIHNPSYWGVLSEVVAGIRTTQVGLLNFPHAIIVVT